MNVWRFARTAAALSAFALIPVAAASIAETTAHGSHDAVDVNRASVAQLLTVPGMTEVWARRIVRFRPYRAKNDLVNRGVVSPESYRRIRDGIVARREGTLASPNGAAH